ncbi:MAG: CsgG/HfaB family protein [Armatimonadota bacterium]|nr:CsgG/HfaB family protein [Armatimonadota bacterium]
MKRMPLMIAAVLVCATAVAQPQEAAVTQPGPPVFAVPVVAVMPFEDGSVRADWGWHCRGTRYRAGAGIADMVANELAFEADRRRTFRLVERERLFEVLDEQDLGREGRIDPRTAARIGRILGADLLVMGAVTRLDVEEDWIGLPWRMGFEAERWEAVAVFDGRLVDSETAESVADAMGRGRETRLGGRIFRGDLAGLDIGGRHFQQSLLGRAAREAARSFAREVAVQLDRMVGATCDWLAEADALVVYVEDGRVMLNRGARDGVRPGEVYRIRRLREEIHDPITGELLTTIYDELGVLTVRDVEEKVCIGGLEPAPDAPGPPRVGDMAIRLRR